MDKYNIGTIFELYENDSQQYVIINNLEKENNIYLLVAPIENQEITKVKYDKAILLNVNKKSEEINFETNEEIITQIVDDTIKRVEEQKN